MKPLRYIALIHKQPGTLFGVTFPDIPGLASSGDTLDRAIAGGQEALNAHINWMRADGDPLPVPRSFAEVVAEAHAEGLQDELFLAVPMEYEPKVGKAVRVSVTIDEYLLSDIDAAATRMGSNRSAFLAEGARKLLQV
jgi:predicted RNase H-like HicB family nuclease